MIIHECLYYLAYIPIQPAAFYRFLGSSFVLIAIFVLVKASAVSSGTLRQIPSNGPRRAEVKEIEREGQMDLFHLSFSFLASSFVDVGDFYRSQPVYLLLGYFITTRALWNLLTGCIWIFYSRLTDNDSARPCTLIRIPSWRTGAGHTEVLDARVVVFKQLSRADDE